MRTRAKLILKILLQVPFIHYSHVLTAMKEDLVEYLALMSIKNKFKNETGALAKNMTSGFLTF